MKTCKTLSWMAGAVLAFGALSIAAPASAAEVGEVPDATAGEQTEVEPAVEWVVVNRETGARFTQDDLTELIPEPAATAPEGSVTPYLINDPVAYAACFGFPQNANYPLASYGNVSFATGTVYLQCGPIGLKSYGWHHMQSNHQSQWEGRVVQMTGLPYGSPGTPAWDDFMESFIKQTLWEPGGITKEYSGKRCYTAIFDVYRLSSNGTPVYQYTFNPTTILSMSNNRVISSYPTTSQDCTRQAPWW